jgi:hypothetical protein
MRTWTRLGSAVLLAIPLTAPSLRADAELNAKNIEKLQNEVAQLRKDVAQLQKDILDNAAQRSANAEQLRSIRDLLARMARQQETITRQAGYDARSVTPPLPGTLPPTARILLENVYASPATVRVNGQSYRVEPNQTLPVTAPVGTLQYSVEVDGYGLTEPLRTDNLPPAGYRIRIFPRMPY